MLMQTARGSSTNALALSVPTGAPRAGVMIHWIATGWTNPAAGVPTEAYVTVNIAGVNVVVAAKANRSTVSVRDGLTIRFPGPHGLIAGDKISQEPLLLLQFNGTAPTTSDMTIGYSFY